MIKNLLLPGLLVAATYGSIGATQTIHASDRGFVLDGIVYKIDHWNEARVCGFTNDAIDIVIPYKITYDNVEYDVSCVPEYFDNKEVNNTLRSVNTGPLIYLDWKAFKNCVALEEVTMPDVNQLYWEAFRGCTSLTKVEMPNVTYLAEGCFRDCTSLKECNVSKVERIEPLAFMNCTALESLVFETPELYAEYDPRTISGQSSDMIEDEEYVDPMYPKYFAGCTSLRELIIKGEYIPLFNEDGSAPDDGGIPAGSLDGCIALEHVYVNYDRVYRSNCISGATDLKSITIGNNAISYFTADAITGCSINEIHCMFPIPPVCLADNAIDTNKQTCVVYVPKGCRDRYLQSDYWSKYANIVEDADVQPLFDASMAPGEIVYSDNVYGYQLIGRDNELAISLAGFQYVGMKEQTPIFSNSIINPNYEAYNEIAPLYSTLEIAFKTPEEPIVIGSSEYTVTEVAPFTAYYYRYLKSIEIGEGVTHIGNYSFANTNIVNAGEIILPSTLQSIGEGAFEITTFKGSITCYAMNPPSLMDDTLFSSREKRQGITLYVPAEAVATYKSTLVWADFNIMAVSGIDNVEAEVAGCDAEYYNLQGMRVTPDRAGVYIRRAGGEVTKVMIK